MVWMFMLFSVCLRSIKDLLIMDAYRDDNNMEGRRSCWATVFVVTLVLTVLLSLLGVYLWAGLCLMACFFSLLIVLIFCSR